MRERRSSRRFPAAPGSPPVRLHGTSGHTCAVLVDESAGGMALRVGRDWEPVVDERVELTISGDSSAARVVWFDRRNRDTIIGLARLFDTDMPVVASQPASLRAAYALQRRPLLSGRWFQIGLLLAAAAVMAAVMWRPWTSHKATSKPSASVNQPAS